MRCPDVSRAIATPDEAGAISEAEIEAHLAWCSQCAKLAEGIRRFDRLWELTRPELPSPASWEAAWSRIDRELALPELPAKRVVPSASARPFVSQMPIRLALGLALAAAVVLLGLNLPEPAPTTAGHGPVYGTFDVPIGHTVLYHVDTAEHQVIQVIEPNVSGDDDLTFFGQSEAGLDAVDYFALFGWFEAMPSLMASAPSEDGSSPFAPLP